MRLSEYGTGPLMNERDDLHFPEKSEEYYERLLDLKMDGDLEELEPEDLEEDDEDEDDDWDEEDEENWDEDDWDLDWEEEEDF